MTEPLVLVTIDDYICHIQLNRAHKHNAANRQMIAELAQAFTVADSDSNIRVVAVSAIGPHFTAGLDIGDVLSTADKEGIKLIPEGMIDPWAINSRRISKPVIVAASGTCLTLGVELMLAADIAIADETSIFGQIEASRGILPFGGATLRFPARCGWGNAMKWMLTGETFPATEALRIGLIQEITPAGEHNNRALELAREVASQAPLASAAIIRNATVALVDPEAAIKQLPTELDALLASEDFATGIASFTNRSKPVFKGK